MLIGLPNFITFELWAFDYPRVPYSAGPSEMPMSPPLAVEPEMHVLEDTQRTYPRSSPNLGHWQGVDGLVVGIKR
jgi:hypothetical protein